MKKSARTVERYLIMRIPTGNTSASVASIKLQNMGVRYEMFSL